MSSLLSDDFELDNDILIKEKIKQLILKSNYPNKEGLCLSNMEYKTPSKLIKNHDIYTLTVYKQNDIHYVKWIKFSYSNKYTIRINNCTIGLDEFLKDEYFFQLFEPKN